MWSTDAIVDAALTALRERELALREEQAVRGLDALEEVELHPFLAAGLAAHGWGVLREQAYPHEWRRKLAAKPQPDAAPTPDSAITSVAAASTDEFPASPAASAAAFPLPRDRLRCDLVLTHEPGQALVDDLVVQKSRRKRVAAASGTLFEAAALSDADRDAARSARSGAAPEDAFWLEIKLVRQFDLSTGAPGFNRSYASELVGGVTRDLKKLASDPRVHHAGVLLVLFTLDRAVAEHDLGVMLHTVMDRGAPVRSATVRSMDIQDRLGNGMCSLCLVGAARAS